MITAPLLHSPALGWTLLHSLWQGAAALLIVAALWPLARKWRAGSRYGLCSIALLITCAAAVATWFVLNRDASTPSVAASTVAIETPGAALPPADSALVSPGLSDEAMPWLTTFWFLGVIVFSVRRLGAWAALGMMTRALPPAPREITAVLHSLSERMGLNNVPRLRVASSLASPAAAGILRPVIFLPAAVLTGAAPELLEAVLAHELAHIRRDDYLVNLLQCAAETLFFYHPAVWWLSRQMRIEREHACDDLAINVSGDPVLYARALVEVAGQASQHSLAVAASGGSLSARILRILTGEMPSTRPPVWLAALILAALGFAALSGNHALLARAQSIDPPPAPAPAAEPLGAAFPSPAGAPLAPARSTMPLLAQNAPPPKPAERPAASEGSGEDYLAAMMHSGLQNLSIEDLIRLRQHGVTPEFTREALRAYPSADKEDVIRLAIHGADMAYIGAVSKLLPDKLSLEDIIRLRVHGVEPAYIERMRGLLGPVNAEDVVKLRIHGAEPADVERLKRSFPNLNVEQVVRLRIAGL
jgi:beta-lactamase regulating signal transducer with metallopeptidase domain